MKTKTNKKSKINRSLATKLVNGLKLALIPHKKNNYHPHLIRGYGLVAVVLVVVGIQFGYNQAKTGSVLGRESDITVTSLLDQTNKSRAEANISALSVNTDLNKAAYLKAQDMFDKQYWAHDAPDGTPPWKWFGDVGYNYDEAGENLAKNFATTSGVMTAWLNSAEHRKNVLKDVYKDVGFAIVSGQLNGAPTTLVVALYGVKADVVATRQPSFSGASSTKEVNILSQFAVASQSTTPAVIGSVALLLFVFLVAILAHMYRRKLPKSVRMSWRRHHGLYKAVGLLSLCVSVVFMYGGGQI